MFDKVKLLVLEYALMNFNDFISDKSQPEFAKLLGVSQTIVNSWVRGVKRISSKRVIDICLHSGWIVTPHELRPDLYPHPDDGLPSDMRCDCQKAA